MTELEVKERAFRGGYSRGWVAATDALAQLCERRGLSPVEAAEVLRAHKADAIAKWADGPLSWTWPPRVPKRARAGE